MPDRRVMIFEDDPLWSALVRRIVARDPGLTTAAADPDVVVVGGGALRERAAPSIVAAARAAGAHVVALVERQDAETSALLDALGITDSVLRSAPTAALVAALRD